MQRPRVFDGFVFFNELDLLEIRLAELAPIVDRFVLVEAVQTFTGLNKPLHFRENRERFAPWLDKIVHVVVDFSQAGVEAGASPWTRETVQRNAILQGMKDVHPLDIAIISDVDEIPKPRVLERVLRRGDLTRTLVCLEAREFNYALDLRNPSIRWTRGPRIAPVGAINTADLLRRFKVPRSRRLEALGLDRTVSYIASRADFNRFLKVDVVPDAAWHFTYQGTRERLVHKIAAFSHQEMNVASVVQSDYLEKRIGGRKAVHANSDEALELVDPDELPEYVRLHVNRFRHMLSDETIAALQARAKR